jgi:hypothetical protein
MATTTSTTPTPADAIGAALSAHPGATAAELAEVAGIGRSTAAKCLAALERAGTARRAPGGREGGRRLPDRWHLAKADTPDIPSAGGGHDTGHADDSAGSVEAPAARLGKGALRDLVLAYLAAHADGSSGGGGLDADGLGATAIAKGLGGKSSGAVGNALQRLEAEGKVRLVQASPRRYRTTGS